MTEHEGTAEEIIEPARYDHLRSARITKHNLGTRGPKAYAAPATGNVLLEAILDTQISMAESARIQAIVVALGNGNSFAVRNSVEMAALVTELRNLCGFIDLQTPAPFDISPRKDGDPS